MIFLRVNFIAICFCFGLEIASAQSSITRTLNIGVNTQVGFAKGTEERFSKSIQTGKPVVFGIDGALQDGKSIFIASFEYSSGDFHYNQNKAVNILRKSTEVNLSYGRNLLQGKSTFFEVYGGVNLGFLWTKRDYTELLNNNKSYEILVPLDLQVLATWKFGASSPFQIQNQILFSAAGLYKQPAFGNVGTSGNSLEKWELTSLNGLTRFRNQTLLTLRLAQSHSIGLNYIFKNYSLTTGRNVKYFEHSVGACYKLSL